jgi:hypothetical protein
MTISKALLWIVFILRGRMAMLTKDQIELLARWRKFDLLEDYADLDLEWGIAADACKTLIAEYCRNPERVAWSDLRETLKQAGNAIGFDPEQVAAALAAEAAEQRELDRLFPHAAWQKEVAKGSTDLGYGDWLSKKREAMRQWR